MKKRIVSCMAACMLFCAGMFAQVFVIERGTNTTLTYTDIKAAVDALQTNDRLYLPPGVHDLSAYKWMGYDGGTNYTSTLVVNKKVSIYGAGYTEGANSTVISNGLFMIGKDASGTLVTGIRFDGTFTLDNVSNCVVTRCKTNSTFNLSGTGTNINVSECDFKSYVYTTYSPYTTLQGAGLLTNFSKCIFRDTSNSLKTSTLSNCIFLYMHIFTTFDKCTLSNNVFVVSQNVTNTQFGVRGSDNSFAYNLWVGGYTTSEAAQNNTFKNEMTREDYANVFVDPDKGDYHLKTACIGKNKGSDKTDVGIYGTTIPFKESRLPSIPNFSVKVISTETDASGKLPVNIVIDAQDR